MKLYVVRKGDGYWEFVAEKKDWWTKTLKLACHFTSIYMANRVARRTGGEVHELVTAPVRAEERKP